jgi:hypothetical protein
MSYIPSWYESIFYKLGLYRLMLDSISFISLTVLYIAKPSLGKEFLSTWFSYKRIQYSQDTSYHKFDILELQKPSKDKPILVFLHGGSWGSGRLYQYALPMKRMGELIDASHAIILGYPVYPMGTIEDQTLAVKKGIEYIRNQSELKSLFHPSSGAAPRLVLAGHSSGAHIALLAVLRGVMKNEDSLCDCYLGFSGPFNLVTHYEYKKKTNQNHTSPMLIAANGPTYLSGLSPTLVLKEYLDNKKKDPSKYKEELPYIGLLQGLKDDTVPDHHSKDFLEILKSHDFTRCKGVFPKVVILIFALFPDLFFVLFSSSSILVG